VGIIPDPSGPQPAARSRQRLVIAGSDKRGTIFGIYDLSEQIGVSPWYWWADVPVQHRTRSTSGRRTAARRARGQVSRHFLNDEAPALSGWVKEKYGTYNHQFYEKVFELMLRLKANYLWPAMWGNAFNEDDPLNPQIADDVRHCHGHIAPRAHAARPAGMETARYRALGLLQESSNSPEVLGEGIKRNKNYESIITLGMRGDGDLPMAGSGGQHRAAGADCGRSAQDYCRAGQSESGAVPQDWALYKEVQGILRQRNARARRRDPALVRR
jgi:hypothetical protein